MPELSDRLKRFKPSQIGEMWDMAQKLKSEGRTIFDLSSGEPDFRTEDAASEAAHRAIDSGNTKYTAVDGTPELKGAVQRKFLREGHGSYADNCIAVGNGAKPLLANILMVLLNAGDEVVIPGPCWASYPGMVQILEAVARIPSSSADEGYKITGDGLRRALNPKSRAVILCSPTNPTGAVYRLHELLELAEVIREYPDVWIIADEIYSEIIYDGVEHVSLVVAAPDLANRIITLNGVSKSYAMTGWRIGFAAGPEQVMTGLRKAMTQVTGSPSSISQAAAVAALDGPRDGIADRKRIYQERRDRVFGFLTQVPQLKTTRPEGAFYLYVDCTGTFGQLTPDGYEIHTSKDLAMYFLDQHGVAVVPAEAFESRGAFRLSFATSLEVLEGACRGIVEACRRLS